MDSVSLLNGILLVASIIALHLISGKTNRERRWGFWITVGTQPLFLYGNSGMDINAIGHLSIVSKLSWY